jgi:ketosteroid isomerase-like protein
MHRAALLILIMTLVSACSTTGGSNGAAMESLLATDAAWSAAAARGDLDEVASYWTPDAVLHVPNAPALEGRAAIRAFLGETAQQPGFSLSWHATGASVSEDGSLGYTHGPYVLTLEGPYGDLISLQGTYLTVFERQGDGGWRCTYELQCPAGPPPGVGT